jgi:dolichol-phosphate mannosyltransferase
LAISEFDWNAIKTLQFVKNAGHMAALDAGIRHSQGDFVITLDSDLQHPPELIIPMLNLAEKENLDVVYGVRAKRKNDSYFKRNSAKIYYSTMRWLSKTDVTPSAADFRLISKRVVSVIRQLPVGRQVFRMLIPSLGFPSGKMEFEADERAGGESKYTIPKMVSLWSASVVTSSTFPLAMATRIGFIVSILSLLGFGYVLFSYVTGLAVEGWASLLSAVLLLFGTQFIILGLMGNYIAVIVTTLRGIPPYILKED